MLFRSNPVTRKVVYSRDVVFREVKDVIKHEVQPKESVKIEFELKEEKSKFVVEEESEDEEPQTLGVRRSVRERRQPERYRPSAFGTCTYASHPNTLRCEREGFIPVHPFFGVLSSNIDEGDLLTR